MFKNAGFTRNLHFFCEICQKICIIQKKSNLLPYMSCKKSLFFKKMSKNLHNSKKKCNFATQNVFFVKKSTLFIVFSLFVSTLLAQNTTSYYCDFENPVENAQWVLNAGNKGATSKNKWYMDAAGSFGIGSTQGLYIADTSNPDECGYVAQNYDCFQCAYRDLDLRQGSYTIQFDWKGLGRRDNDQMYVFWVPNGTNVFSDNSSTVAKPLPTFVSANPIKLYGEREWTSYSGTLNVTQAGGKLVIMWVNKMGTPSESSCAIDNIRIYLGTPCVPPTSPSYNLHDKKLQWNGTATSYDVLVYNTKTQNYSAIEAITDTETTIPSLTEEGVYNFYVRVNCGDSLHTSKWVYCSQFVWIPGLRCLDFLDITPNNSGVAKCFSGSYSGGANENLKVHSGATDFGYASANSLHTIHYIQGETDPRTGNRLKTIPDDEVASVRINGLWEDTHNQTATVEYEYTPRSGTSDLLILKYACVLEAEGHPDPNDQPRFKLQILDAHGDPIDACSQADFMAGFASGGVKWNRYQYNSRQIDWCDWQTVTVSLRNYIGQSLTIRLTAYTCSATIHLGYAYFTLNCASGDLQGIACGDYSTDHFTAPEGFNYRWYWEGDEDKKDKIPPLCTFQTFNCGSTTDSVYLVDLISKTNPNCYYTLTANPNPRYPRAYVQLQNRRPINCENRVSIQNNCRVYFVNRISGEDMPTQRTEPVQSVTWDWGDGSPVEENNDNMVEHVFPQTGGTFVVKTTASMSDGICKDSVYTTVTVPNILSNPTADSLNFCRAETPTYKLPDGTVMDHDTIFSTFVQNQYGCDVEQAHHLFFHDSALSVKDTTFCEGGYIDFEGKKYWETGTYKVPLKTVYGCDSTMQLNLTVIPRLQIAVDTIFTVCGDGTLDIPFDIIKGNYNGVKVHLGDTVYRFGAKDPISIPMYDEEKGLYLRPDQYDVILELGTPDCPVDPVRVKANIQYASFIMYQKHGYIGLYNSENNTYGFDFAARFTWYCNDELMPNDTLPYIHVSDEDWGKMYRVEVIRLDDGKKLGSCPLIYTYGMPQGVEDLVTDEEIVAYFDILGRRYATLPKQKGVYVVVYSNHVEKVVVETN